METVPLSASYKRFLSLTEEVRDKFPSPRHIAGEEREQLYRLLHEINDCGEVMKLAEGHSTIFVYDSTKSLAECHYSRSFIDRLHEMEQKITPKQTVLEEVSTGSAGNAFGLIGGALGYSRRITITRMDPVRRALIEEAMNHGKNEEVFGEIMDVDGFLVQAIDSFQARVFSGNNVKLRHEKKLAFPNHSIIPTTVESCRAIARDALLKIQGAPLDAIVLAVGNGTSAIGFHDVFREAYPNVELHVFEGAHAPYAYEKINGPLAEEVREPEVTLFGADGATNLPRGLKFPEAARLISENRITKSWLVRKQDWEEAFERINLEKVRRDTFGRTSAAAVDIARQLAADGKLGILTIRYDLADRYQNTLVTSEEAKYLGNGTWSEGVTL
ncbi:MAG: pyridoxal-phosphate dependent enzyme [Patescibacteria group bacterium]